MNSISTEYEYVLDLLEELVKEAPTKAIRVVACTTREDLFDQVVANLRARAEASSNTDPRDDLEAESPPAGLESTSHHAFTSPVLSLLSASQNIHFSFCPSIPMLRAYFASQGSAAGAATAAMPSRTVIFNVLAQHHGSSEFTLQGLSQTLATIASASLRTRAPVQLVECKDVRDPSNPDYGSGLWDAEVPLLSASIKIGEGGARWGRRTVPVALAAGRWFRTEGDRRRSTAQGVRDRHTEVADSEDDMLI